MDKLPSLAWHAVPARDVVRELMSDVASGLTSVEAAARLERFGPNIISARAGHPWWVRLLMQFHAPLVYILLVAGVVTLALGEHVDSAVIFAVVIVNAAVGYVQETRAAKAIEALARFMHVEATVTRDGQKRRVDASALVVGDLVSLEAGDRVPADIRLLDERIHEVRVDESMLTGESMSVGKAPGALPVESVLADRDNMAYAGTLVTRGSGMGVVVATADATEVGRISEMLSSVETIATPLTRRIAAFSRLLLWIILVVASATFVIGLIRGLPPAEAFMAAVALAVGAIPEGLPAAVTIMLAVGVAQMARRNAIIRHLPAVEALGSTTVICSDKTGTLTQNQMTVLAAWAGGREFELTGAGYDPAGEFRADGGLVDAAGRVALAELMTCGALCNDAQLLAIGVPNGTAQWAIRGDPTEAALVVAARKAGLTQEALAQSHPRVNAIPFDSERQYMATLHGRTGAGQARVVYVKGSVERVLTMCAREGRLTAWDADGRQVEVDAGEAYAAAEAMARRGLRVLAFARCEAEPDAVDLTYAMVEQGAGAPGDPRAMTLLGLQGMLDPPRPEAIEAVAACQRAGIRVKMITGDHAVTAATVAGMIGIDGDDPSPRVLTGAQMAAIPDERIPEIAEATAVFARMTPEQKLRLVTALQSRGHIIAMTGDGVNDAPALRQADIGVAMGRTGTEVAKDASDMVLADDNFATIEAAVEEGRSVFSNLTKFIVWTLPTNGAEALVILSAIALGWPLPILPVHALYINMTTAVLLGMPLVFEKKARDIMSRPPRDPARPLLTYALFMRTGLVSLLLCTAAMLVFHVEQARGMSEDAARTAAVSVIVVGEAFYLFSSRALLRPAWAVPAFSNLWLWAGIGAMLTVHAAFVHVPLINRLFHSAALDAGAWARVFLAGAAVLVIVEVEKAIRRATPAGADVEGA